MAAEGGIAGTGEQITTTREPLEHYIRQWGAPDHVSALADGTTVAVWQGQGYAFWVADFGGFRAAVAF